MSLWLSAFGLCLPIRLRVCSNLRIRFGLSILCAMLPIAHKITPAGNKGLIKTPMKVNANPVSIHLTYHREAYALFRFIILYLI